MNTTDENRKHNITSEDAQKKLSDDFNKMLKSENTDEQLNNLIAAREKEISDLEQQLTDLSYKIKVKKAKLKQLKKVNEQPSAY